MARKKIVGAIAVGATLFGGVALSNCAGAISLTEADLTDGVYTLTENITDGIIIPSGLTVTVNLNDKEVTNTSDHVIQNYGNLKVVGEGSVSIEASGKAALMNYQDAVADIRGGDYLSRKWYTIQNKGTMTLGDGVSIEQENDGNSASVIDNIGNNTSSAILTINGGNYVADGDNCNIVKNDDYGVAYINGGTFYREDNTSNGAGAIVLNWHRATINGGTFTTEADAPVIVAGYMYEEAEEGSTLGETTINGGTFNANQSSSIFGIHNLSTSGGFLKVTGGTFNKAIADVTEQELKIFGGTFGTEPKAGINNNYEVVRNDNDTFTVKLKVPTIVDLVNDDDQAKGDNESALEELVAGIFDELAGKIRLEGQNPIELSDGIVFKVTNGNAFLAALDGDDGFAVEIVFEDMAEVNPNSVTRTITGAVGLLDDAKNISIILRSGNTELGRFVKLGETSIEIVLPIESEVSEVEEGYERSWGVIHLNEQGFGDNIQAQMTDEGLMFFASEFSPYIPYYIDGLAPVVNPGEIILDDNEEEVVPTTPDTGALGMISKTALVVLGLTSLIGIALIWTAKAKR